MDAVVLQEEGRGARCWAIVERENGDRDVRLNAADEDSVNDAS